MTKPKTNADTQFNQQQYHFLRYRQALENLKILLLRQRIIELEQYFINQRIFGN